jgi:hypothetical protein
MGNRQPIMTEHFDLSRNNSKWPCKCGLALDSFDEFIGHLRGHNN